jgi:aspartyl-tRNA synthetase
VLGEKRARIEEINATMDGSHILLRARVQNLRLQGTYQGKRCGRLITGSKMIFFELRQQTDTVQALLQQSAQVSKQMYKFSASVNPESIVLIRGVVKKSPIEISATTVKDAEIHISQVQSHRVYIDDRSGSFLLLRQDCRSN